MQASTGTYHSILCGIDFSKESARALRYADALAQAGRGKLAAAYVVDPLLSSAAAVAYDSDKLTEAARKELRRFIHKTLGARRAEVVDSVILVGKAGKGMLDAARQSGADLIVIGTHGLSGIKKLFFGSTAQELLRQSPVPVLAVPPGRSAPRRGWPAGLIIAPLPMGKGADLAAVNAERIASAYGATLKVVVPVAKLRLPFWLRAQERAINREQSASAKDFARAHLVTHGSGRRIGVAVEIGEGAEDVAAYAARQKADLIVVSAHEGGPEFDDTNGAYRMARQARCPVLLLK